VAHRQMAICRWRYHLLQCSIDHVRTSKDIVLGESPSDTVSRSAPSPWPLSRWALSRGYDHHIATWHHHISTWHYHMRSHCHVASPHAITLPRGITTCDHIGTWHHHMRSHWHVASPHAITLARGITTCDHIATWHHHMRSHWHVASPHAITLARGITTCDHIGTWHHITLATWHGPITSRWLHGMAPSHHAGRTLSGGVSWPKPRAIVVGSFAHSVGIQW
jgi:hypothetical protein